MASPGVHSIREQAAWALVRAQHGVVARAQLLEAGYTARAIRSRGASGRLHRLFPGVYAVGRPDVTREGWWMAAVLMYGEGTVLSHRSAAALYGVLPDVEEIHVSVLSSAWKGRAGIEIHRRNRLAPPDRRIRDGIPVTSIILTLVDLAADVSNDELERAISAADKLGLITPSALRRGLGRHRGRPGVAELRKTLDRRTFRLTDSQLERRFLALVRDAGLPLPVTRARVSGFLVDFHWPDLGLVVETDGLRYHRTPTAQAKDRKRDNAHTAAGLTCLRFTHEQVRYDPEYVTRTLATAMVVSPPQPRLDVRPTAGDTGQGHSSEADRSPSK